VVAVTCKSCLEKWKEYYVKKGYSDHSRLPFLDSPAMKMSRKIVKRLEKRIKQEKEYVYDGRRYVPIFLLEKAGEGVPLYFENEEISQAQKMLRVLKRWVFVTNWKGTFWWSFKHHSIIWIGHHLGAGSNPGYTMVCKSCIVSSGVCNYNEEYCASAVSCRSQVCTGVCQTPSDPNSTATSNDCTCTKGGCICTSKMCEGGTPTCTYQGGTCGYTCTLPWVWNGSACVLGGGILMQRRVRGVGLFDTSLRERVDRWISWPARLG